MSEQTMTEQDAIRRGGRLWEGGPHRRVYFNFTRDDLLDAAGYEIRYYGTGNVSRATLDGTKISNRAGSEAVAAAAGLKAYVDCRTGALVIAVPVSHLRTRFTRAAEALIAALPTTTDERAVS